MRACWGNRVLLTTTTTTTIIILMLCYVATSVLIELGLLVFFIFVPGLDKAFFTYNRQPFIYFLPFLISAAALIVWGELRKFLIRTYPTSKFSVYFSY